MSSKLLVIVSTGENEKALTGLAYAYYAMDQGWMDEVKVVLMGPSEKLLVEDEEFIKIAKQMAEVDPPTACKLLSDNAGISDRIEALGLKVDYVGSLISNFIKDGFVPMVF